MPFRLCVCVCVGLLIIIKIKTEYSWRINALVPRVVQIIISESGGCLDFSSFFVLSHLEGKVKRLATRLVIAMGMPRFVLCSRPYMQKVKLCWRWKSK